MIKLVDVKKDFRFGQDTVIKPASLQSPRSGGFEYAIVNEFTQEEPLKFTIEQAQALFSAGVPQELLTLEPSVAKLIMDLQQCKSECSLLTDELSELKAKPKKAAPKKEVK